MATSNYVGSYGELGWNNCMSVNGGDAGRSLPPHVSSESTLKYQVRRGTNVFGIDITTK